MRANVASRWALGVVLGLTAASTAVSPAQASPALPAAQSFSAATTTPTGDYQSTLTITFNDGRVLSGPAAQKAVAAAVSPAAQPSGAYLYCDHAYSFSDSNGTYHFQHACGGSTGPWGYNISAADCSIAVSTVKETGMAWTRNGVNQGANSGHNVGCSYTFHGTYNPDKDYDFITYSDTFTFAVEVDGDPGTANLHLSGSFTSAGCNSGKACGQAQT